MWQRQIANPIRIPHARLVCYAALALLLTGPLVGPSAAHAQINSSGRHARYTAELEPHLIWQWAGDETSVDDGIGFGFRVSIPLMQDGPIPSINNNLALAFGVDWAHFSNDCRLIAAGVLGSCSEDDFWVPITLQWNFFLTQMISVFPELGLGFRDAVFDREVCYNGRCRGSDLTVYPVLWFGGRFKLNDYIALVLRLGTPSLQFGVSFFL